MRAVSWLHVHPGLIVKLSRRPHLTSPPEAPGQLQPDIRQRPLHELVLCDAEDPCQTRTPQIVGLLRQDEPCRGHGPIYKTELSSFFPPSVFFFFFWNLSLSGLDTIGCHRQIYTLLAREKVRLLRLAKFVLLYNLHRCTLNSCTTRKEDNPYYLHPRFQRTLYIPHTSHLN